MSAESPETSGAVEYYIKNGQLSWALVALIVGMPASWKFLGMVGAFIARRFDNRDDMVARLLDAQKREMEVRMVEAQALKAIGDGMHEIAEAVISIARNSHHTAHAVVE